MIRVARLVLLSLFGFGLLSACVVSPEITEYKFLADARQHLQMLEKWQFNGRIALQNQENSWSANIEWLHESEQDRLLLSGPFGQGAVKIILQPESITIDYGDGTVVSSQNVNEFIFQQLGFFVPAYSLRYWVLGAVVPDTKHFGFDDGFSQMGWDVRYRRFTSVKGEILPAKIKVFKGKEKLKLIIDHWELNDGAE